MLTETEKWIASSRRTVSLLEKLEAGQALTPADLDEIRKTHPDFACIVPNGESASDSSRVVKLTKADEPRYEKLYGKKWRQIRRWIDRGEESGDPCPLHDPAKMPGWWSRNMKWRVPAEIEMAALSAANPPSAPDPDPDPAAPPPPASSPARQMVNPIIDLESIDPEEGDRLRELKQIQAAKFTQLKNALKGGEDCAMLESKYLKLSETIDKIETRVTERLKKRGLFILREVVERDLAAAAELLRQSRSSMVRRVHELCPSLTADQRAEVTVAIERARASEERMLCQLETLSTNDLLRELAA